ncbi:hypothetical protein [Borrelia persica]|nr:hypothetical protein [Borrelia persica]
MNLYRLSNLVSSLESASSSLSNSSSSTVIDLSEYEFDIIGFES